MKNDLLSLLEDGICISQTESFDETADKVNGQTREVVNVLTALQDFSRNELTSLRQTFDGRFSPQFDAVFEFSLKGESYSRAMYAAAPVPLLGLILCFGAIAALWYPNLSTYFCFQTWVVLPLFFILVFVAGIYAAASSVWLTMNSGKQVFRLSGNIRICNAIIFLPCLS